MNSKAHNPPPLFAITSHTIQKGSYQFYIFVSLILINHWFLAESLDVVLQLKYLQQLAIKAQVVAFVGVQLLLNKNCGNLPYQLLNVRPVMVIAPQTKQPTPHLDLLASPVYDEGDILRFRHLHS